MIEDIAQKPEARKGVGALVTATRAVLIVAAVALMGFWVLMCEAFHTLPIDYPLRRAGESAEYPPFGTLAFYWGCAKAVLGTHVIWISLFAMPLSFLIKGFGVASWRARFLLSVAVLTLPVVVFAAHGIYFYKVRQDQSTHGFKN